MQTNFSSYISLLPSDDDPQRIHHYVLHCWILSWLLQIGSKPTLNFIINRQASFFNKYHVILSLWYFNMVFNLCCDTGTLLQKKSAYMWPITTVRTRFKWRTIENFRENRDRAKPIPLIEKFRDFSRNPDFMCCFIWVLNFSSEFSTFSSGLWTF